MIVVTVYDVLKRIREDDEALVIKLKVTPTNKEANKIRALLKERVKARDVHYHRGDREVRILFPPRPKGQTIIDIENELTFLLAHHVFDARRRRSRGK